MAAAALVLTVTAPVVVLAVSAKSPMATAVYGTQRRRASLARGWNLWFMLAALDPVRRRITRHP